MTFLLNYWRFCDIDHFTGLFSPSGGIFNSLRLNKGNFTTIECLKRIIKCFYHLVFMFVQFLDFKLIYLLNYWRFCDFDPFTGPFFAFWRYFSLFEAKFRKYDNHGVLEMYYKMFVPISFQVWPIFRLQIDIFVELLPILWFWPLLGTLFGHFASFCTLWS